MMTFPNGNLGLCRGTENLIRSQFAPVQLQLENISLVFSSIVPHNKMRPILLQGTERALTQIKFNHDGDLLFSCSKDQTINVWYTHNGERLGTYDGHNGAVWTVDVDSQCKLLVSGSADNTMRLWSVQTGKCLYSWEFPTAVKRVAFSEDDDQVVCVTEQRMGYQSTVRIFNINREDPTNQSEEPASIFYPIGSRLTLCSFAYTPSLILTGHESGKVALFDAKTGDEVLSNERAHMDVVTDLQLSADRSYFITSSKDKTARIHDTKTLSVLKTFTTETPLNSAALAPGKPYVLLGGGQDAMTVTTTSLRQGKFETRFWHKIFEEEVGRVKGHFGPVNTIAVSPKGDCYASGGEDGFVRVHHFDESYFKARPYGDLEIEE
ncbi:WD40 repeat-like protein [Sparassis latifolia]|uniref:Eukaryotic translation initiation factor 3 subunit I n=1 Tax=Sparassis crispa TaxID=139825 RepID=A0A401GSJ2_9APHY|nr:Eukaryotic translation initiation factor 3 subunit I [Sparassis crispa]GBE85198.1 Eukaryotic translation initiation factor 3 subunit I [Sparassis crispa]